MNHVYTTETLGKELGKEQRTTCQGFTNKNFKYIPVHWDKCQAKSGKLTFLANHTVVDWGPHSMWLSNCSDDINSIVCDYILEWHGRLPILQEGITMTEDFLDGMRVECPPPRP